MNYYRNNIVVFLCYVLGINLYFSFWYLGSEGGALDWEHHGLSYLDICLATNLSVAMVIILLSESTVLKALNILNWPPLTIQSILGVLSFNVIILTVCILLASDQRVAVSYPQTAGFLSLNIYHGVLLFVILSLLNLNERFGGLSRIVNYIFKRIYTPREVAKGFMFIDLNRATTLAEQLENGQYSALLRDCFQLLEDIAYKERGFTIYQYVGDEAVLCWDYTNRDLSKKAIKIFHAFKSSLRHRKTYFQWKYGVLPTFKCAIHGGYVTQSEIGKQVPHIAFHGDVLNTASRILGICHKHKSDLLLSASYFDWIKDNKMNIEYERVDDVILNGKALKLTVYKPNNGLFKLKKFKNKMTISHYNKK